jgi:hypothetical protein
VPRAAERKEGTEGEGGGDDQLTGITDDEAEAAAERLDASWSQRYRDVEDVAKAHAAAAVLASACQWRGQIAVGR